MFFQDGYDQKTGTRSRPVFDARLVLSPFTARIRVAVRYRSLGIYILIPRPRHDIHRDRSCFLPTFPCFMFSIATDE